MTQQILEIPLLPKRKYDAHKGNFGRVLILGGCGQMVGAPSLSALSALRAGAGLVRVAVPAKIQLTVAGEVLCATTIGLADDDKGFISSQAAGAVLDAIADNDVIAAGPGIGAGAGVEYVMGKIATECDKPRVIDADGLNALSRLGGAVISQLSDNTVLAPHPGEMKRLWRACFREDIPTDRSLQAEKLARFSSAIVVLKGANTVVTCGNRTYVNETGNPGMATGGSGDVLTGIIAAFMGQGYSALDAAILAVYLHGRVGDIAVKCLSQTGLTALDLIDYMPEGLLELEGKEQRLMFSWTREEPHEKNLKRRKNDKGLKRFFGRKKTK